MSNRSDISKSGTVLHYRESRQGGKGGTFKGGDEDATKKRNAERDPHLAAGEVEGETPKLGTKKNTDSGKGSGNR